MKDKQKIQIISFVLWGLFYLFFGKIFSNIYLYIMITIIFFLLILLIFAFKKTGISYIFLMRKKEISKTLNKFIYEKEKHPKKTNLNYYIGYCYYMLGYNTNARSYLEEAIEKGFEYPEVYYILSIIYAEEKNCEKAYKNIKKVKNKENFLKFIKQEIIYNEAEAWVKFLCDNYDEASEIYDKIIKRCKKKICKTTLRFAPIFYHLGIISKHKGEYDKAIKYFKKSIKAGGPESIFTKRSEEEIKRIVNGEL